MITPSSGIELRVTLVGDECSHQCTIPATRLILERVQIAFPRSDFFENELEQMNYNLHSKKIF